jgi:signal peptide peptidase SppA
MRFQHVIDAVYRQPWNITAGGHMAIHEVLQSRLAADYQAGMFADFVNERPDMEIDGNKIAHIAVQGVLAMGMSKIERSCGNTDYSQIEQEFAAAAERGAGGVFLAINSPGGGCAGNAEISQVVADSPLPVVAWVDSLCASAAYSIASGADLIVCAPSAQVGSIGTILGLVDRSGEWEARGWKPAYITHTGGDLKAAGWPASLTEEHKAHFQEVVDDYFGLFRDHVLAHRTVDSAFMRGQCLVGQRALEANLVDKIGTYENAYAEILKRAS